MILQEFCLQSDWSATDADRAGDRKSTRLRRRRFGAAYLTVINHGAAADRLIAAATQMAAKVQFHQEIDDKGVMRMRELPAVDIGPGASVTFKPGGTHIMIVGLKQQLKEGQPLPLTLEFEKAGKIDLQVPVTKAGAMGEHDLKGM